jgi:hypothetical protein
MAAADVEKWHADLATWKQQLANLLNASEVTTTSRPANIVFMVPAADEERWYSGPSASIRWDDFTLIRKPMGREESHAMAAAARA